MRSGYEECDCLEQDVDILTGISSCFDCGRSRWLSDEELRRELQFRAEADQAYAEEMEKTYA